MLSTVNHSYACSLLRKRGIKIFNSGKEILYQQYPLKFPELKSYLRIGYNYSGDFIGEKIIKITQDYKRLNQFGWKISARYAPGIYEYQRIEYFLSPLLSSDTDYGNFPKNHFVLVDLANQKIKLNGENVRQNDWMALNPAKRERRVKKELTPFQLGEIENKWWEDFEKDLPEFLREKEEETIEIPEAIIGITENSEICCIDPKDDVAPRINIAGMSGTGKSQTKNNIQGQLYYKPVHNCNLFEINDVKYDSQTYCLAWDEEHPYYKEIHTLFKEPTIPLPYVYLHPTMKNLKEENILYKDEVGFEISFPFEDFLLDPQLKEFNEQWRTSPASMKYIRDLVEDNHGNPRPDGLLYLDDLDEIEELINKTIPKEIAGSSVSIFALIKDIWSRKILDRNSGIYSKWIATIGEKKYIYPSWDICLLFGLVPSFVTADARNYDWFDIWEKYILKDVFAFAKTKEYRLLQGKKLILCGEELVRVLRKKQSRDIIDQVISEGRTDDIGFISVVQFYSDVPDSIITNLTHHFVFNSKAPKAMKDLKDTFPSLTNTQKKDIANLKAFQCYAFGNLILYDNNGNRNSNNGEPVKIIRIKRPNAQHYWKYKKEEIK